MGSLQGLPPEEIESQSLQLKKLLNLTTYGSRQAQYLSGGNKRKLCSAMALMKAPKILVMDEASNGVDPISRKNLYWYIRRLRDTSTLMITHRIDEGEKICDRIAIMQKGFFLDFDTPNNLKEKHGIVYILQVEPTVSSALNIEVINSRITQTLPFCKRILSNNEDEFNLFRPRLTYRFDEIDTYQRGRPSGEINGVSPNTTTFTRKSANYGGDIVDVEVRRKIIFMFKYVTELVQNGTIIDFSIFRSSLEEVFKKLLS